MRLAALVLSAAALGACGPEPASDNTTTTTVIERRDTDWFTSVDPATGRHFRCTLWWKTKGEAGGLASWCYEPAEGEMP